MQYVLILSNYLLSYLLGLYYIGLMEAVFYFFFVGEMRKKKNILRSNLIYYQWN